MNARTATIQQGTIAILKAPADTIPAGERVTVKHVSTHTSRVGVEWDPDWPLTRRGAWVEASQLEVGA